MKKFFKLFGIIATVAIIGFSFAALSLTGCGGGGGGVVPPPSFLNNLEGNITILPTTADIYTKLFANYDGSEAVTYQWNKNSIAIPNENSEEYTPAEAGSYTVTVSAAGYYSKTSDPVNVTGPSTFTSIAEFSTWLASQTPNRTYTVKLNVSDLGGDSITAGSLGYVLNNNEFKNVNLDLSESTFTDIGSKAFYQCYFLGIIILPDSVTSIGESAFSSSTSLTSVTFATGSNITNANFGNNAFPEGSDGNGGNNLKTAYSTGKAGAYTRTANGSSWTKQL